MFYLVFQACIKSLKHKFQEAVSCVINYMRLHWLEPLFGKWHSLMIHKAQNNSDMRELLLNSLNFPFKDTNTKYRNQNIQHEVSLS